MARWEYISIMYDRLNSEDEFLNSMGADGWELVQILEGVKYNKAIFKREKSLHDT